MAQVVKHLPTTRETRVQSLGQEDPQEKEMATHSSTLAWKILRTEEPGRLLVHGVARSRTRLGDFTFTFTFNVCKVIKMMVRCFSLLFYQDSFLKTVFDVFSSPL